MRPLRFLFAPELGRPLADALRGAAVLRRLAEAVCRRGPPPGGTGGRGKAGYQNAGSSTRSGLLLPVLLLALAGLALTAVPPPEPAYGQTIDRGLFADTDRTTRDVLSFLGGLGRDRPSAVGDMLFAFNAGVLVLAGFLLVWHAAAGVVDTAREGRFGFGACGQVGGQVSAHYGRAEAMAWCEENGVDYIFGLAGNPVLHRFAYGVADDLKVRRAEAGAEKMRSFAAFDYAAGSWNRERRVVARLEASARLRRPLHRHLARQRASPSL